MILELILHLILTLVTAIVNAVNGIFGENTLIPDVNNFINAILTICTQSHNFMYFIFGNTIVIVLPVTIALLTTKYLVVPVIQIFRSFLSKGNE